MVSKEQAEEYFRGLDVSKLLKRLSPEHHPELIDGVEYFSEREGERRDDLVISYFGESGAGRITDIIVDYLCEAPVEEDSRVLDVGAGSGFFTLRVLEGLHNKGCIPSFYAMDLAPVMLRILSEKTSDVVPFCGVAGNIPESIRYARDYLYVPRSFDGVFSTLMLHHSPEPERVFRSFRDVLCEDGRGVIIDLCEHPFEEFRDEMGDLHLGFNPSRVEEMAGGFFPYVRVERVPGIRCEDSGRSAELFVAYL